MSKAKSAGVSLPTLDLHGQRLEGLEDRVDKFIVESQRKGLSRIRIMTGKGSGQVRSAVQTYLKLGGYPAQFEKLPNGSTNDGVLVVHI